MLASTMLFVPGDRPERFGKAAAAGADAMIIDLEDAVAADAKGEARFALRQPGALPPGIAIYVRVNQMGSAWHDADIAALAGLPIAGIVLPKAERASDIVAVYQAMNLPVIALIETASGMAACREIARAAGVARLAFGSIDYAADLGMAHVREALMLARSEIVLASRLGGLAAPVDGVTTVIDDDGTIMDDARHAVSLGFGGKLCIHPRQIAAVRRGFAPAEADIAWARRILAAAQDGAVSVDGAMVDAPVRRRAQAVLNRAHALG